MAVGAAAYAGSVALPIVANYLGRKAMDYGWEKMSKQQKQSYLKGGTVKRTGLAMLHKNELVVPTKHVAAVKKLMMASKIKIPKKAAVKKAAPKKTKCCGK